MRDIKRILKEVGMTQKDFAEKIGLSRPTLDAYIKLYEDGCTIPKERYDIIFKRLFEYEYVTIEEFERKIQQIEKLLERDQKYGTADLSALASDSISILVDNMKRDMRRPDYNEDIYTFINLFISSYSRNIIFEKLAEYFLFLNNIKDINEIDEYQKPYFANMYKVFYDLIETPQAYDEKDYYNFLERCKEISYQKNRQKEKQEENIKKKILEMLNEYERKGVDIHEDEVIEVISKQILKEIKRGV